MQKLKLLSASAVLALGLGMSGSANAAIFFDSVTLNGQDSVSVLAGEMITVIVTVSGNSNTNWQCTKYQIEGEALSADQTPVNHQTNQIEGETDTFMITAPGSNGVYFLDIDIWSNNGCGNDNASTRLEAAIIVGSPKATLSKSLVSGPLESSINVPPDGCDGTNACDGFAFEYELDTGPNDAGAVGLNLLFSQHFVVEIVITNEGADDAINGNVITDTFGADFDLDPIAEEDWFTGGFPLDGVCADACDGTGFDGVDVDGLCSYETTQPPSGDGIGGKKEPEFIDIRVDDLGEDDTCTVLVFVQTVENPGGGNDFWEPTGCRILEFTTGNGTTGDDILDTFTLNEGLKEFDGVIGDRLQGPLGSLQLTCIPLE